LDDPRDKGGAGQTNGRKRSVTIHDVARHAGVSSMTASRVVSGSSKVSDELRKRVLASIAELNYVPNVGARAARSGATRIGVLFSNPRSSNLGAFLMGAFGESSRSGAQLIVEPVAGHAHELDAVKKVVSLGVDGVILPPPLCDSFDAFEILQRAHIPALCFASAMPRRHSAAVLIDDFEGARAMTRHLIALGHRRIAFVRGNPTHSPAIRREEGFRMAMAEAELDVGPDLIAQGDFTYKSGLEVGQQLLDRPREKRPTAIFASNDDMAAAIIAVAHGLDIRVPQDLSVAGFDDTPLASVLWPPLTTVHQPLAEMASKAVEIMTDHIRQARSGGEPEPVHHVAPFTIVERASTAPPGKAAAAPADDEVAYQ
jgi:LacI family transcriptional regulator